MKAFVVSLAALATLTVAFATPAFATTGRQAVGACIDGGGGCEWSRLKDGSIWITKGDTVIHCASAEAQCTTALHRQAGLLSQAEVPQHDGHLQSGNSQGGGSQGAQGSSFSSIRTTAPTNLSLH